MQRKQRRESSVTGRVAGSKRHGTLARDEGGMEERWVRQASHVYMCTVDSGSIQTALFIPTLLC